MGHPYYYINEMASDNIYIYHQIANTSGPIELIMSTNLAITLRRSISLMPFQFFSPFQGGERFQYVITKKSKKFYLLDNYKFATIANHFWKYYTVHVYFLNNS